MIVTEEELLTVKEVAARLRISEDAVFRLLRRKKLPGYKIGGAWRVDRQELERYLEAQRNIDKK